MLANNYYPSRISSCLLNVDKGDHVMSIWTNINELTRYLGHGRLLKQASLLSLLMLSSR